MSAQLCVVENVSTFSSIDLCERLTSCRLGTTFRMHTPTGPSRAGTRPWQARVQGLVAKGGLGGAQVAAAKRQAAILDKHVWSLVKKGVY